MGDEKNVIDSHALNLRTLMRELKKRPLTPPAWLTVLDMAQARILSLAELLAAVEWLLNDRGLYTPVEKLGQVIGDGGDIAALIRAYKQATATPPAADET
jgi:hypothetical protein